MNEDLISRSALIEHLNTTMYRDVIEEIKRFPATTQKSVWIMTADGCVDEYGSEIYVIGVFDTEKAATAYKESIMNEFHNNVPYEIRITKIDTNTPFSMEHHKVYHYETWENDYYLGGYVE